jgi:uncharacterized membrane protein YwaF
MQAQLVHVLAKCRAPLLFKLQRHLSFIRSILEMLRMHLLIGQHCLQLAVLLLSLLQLGLLLLNSQLQMNQLFLQFE